LPAARRADRRLDSRAREIRQFLSRQRHGDENAPAIALADLRRELQKQPLGEA
jgi:hypothetical protein